MWLRDVTIDIKITTGGGEVDLGCRGGGDEVMVLVMRSEVMVLVMTSEVIVLVMRSEMMVMR